LELRRRATRTRDPTGVPRRAVVRARAGGRRDRWFRGSCSRRVVGSLVSGGRLRVHNVLRASQ